MSIGSPVVDCRFFRFIFKCPLAIAMESGKYFCIRGVVTLGHVENWLLFTALVHVAIVGLNVAACRKPSSSFAVCCW